MDFRFNGNARYYKITKGEGDLVIATQHAGAFENLGHKQTWKLISH